ncbi:MAG: arginine--tRNA ligase [Thermodesulfovibrionales bacterium]
MKKTFADRLARALETLGVSPCPLIEIETPREKSFGDLSSPLAMVLAKQLKKPPRKIAEEIAASITDETIFERIEVAGPGFINATFAQAFLGDSLRRLVTGGPPGMRASIGAGKKVLVEFVSANPTGPLHIGHARGAAVGNALCNLLEAHGFQVDREYYVNDAGRQIKMLGLSVHARYLQLLGRDVPFPEEGYRGSYIDDEAAALIREKGERYRDRLFEECGGEISDWACGRMLDLIRTDLAKFGIRPFRNWVSERGMHESGKVRSAVEDLKRRGYLYEQDNALWFRSTDFTDDKDRVVIKSDGEHTYFASDIAYHKDKLDRGYDFIVDIWGADHHGYIPRIASVMQAFGYDTDRFKVILVQMVNLLRHGEPFQMSKRAGTFVTLSEIVDLVGPDITKFIFLTRKADSHLDFDVDVVTASSSENPVFYVQYAHARINSILANAREQGIGPAALEGADLSLLAEARERELIVKLLSYPSVLEGAATTFEPHRVTFFLQELASVFHAYYHDTRVLADDLALAKARIFLCTAVMTVIKDALGLLDVTKPEKM